MQIFTEDIPVIPVSHSVGHSICVSAGPFAFLSFSMQMTIWMIIDFNCGERHEDVIYHRSYTHDLSICEIKARKKKLKLFDFFQALISQLRKLCV